MAENEVKTIPEQISAYLSEALMSSNKAKGMVLLIAGEDGSVSRYSVGDFVTKLGLFSAANGWSIDLWDEAESEKEDEDD